MRTPCRAVALVVVTSCAALVPIPAVATGVPTICAFEYDPMVSPGLTLEPGVGKISSGGETGVVRCDGPVNGHEPTGPGTIGFEGTYGTGAKVSCTSGGSGEGLVLFTVPTAAGPQQVKDRIVYEFGPAAGDLPLFGGWTGPRTEGEFLVLPTKGDCVTAPVEQLRGTGEFVLLR